MEKIITSGASVTLNSLLKSRLIGVQIVCWSMYLQIFKTNTNHRVKMYRMRSIG